MFVMMFPNDRHIRRYSSRCYLVGSRVQEVRKMRGLSLRVVSRRAGVHWSYLERLEKAEVNVQPYVIRRLAEALRVPLDMLLRDPDVYVDPWTIN